MKIKQQQSGVFFNILKSISICFLVISLTACQSKQSPKGYPMDAPRTVSKDYNVTALAGISSILLAYPQLDGNVKSAGSDVTGNVYSIFIESAKKELAVKLFDYNSIPAPYDTSLEGAFKYARSMGVDTVMIPTIYTYKERDGSRYGANEPASVNLALRVYNVNSKSLIWESTFQRTDQSLTENLFKLADGVSFTWKTAEELATIGFTSMCRNFANVRSSSFM